MLSRQRVSCLIMYLTYIGVAQRVHAQPSDLAYASKEVFRADANTRIWSLASIPDATELYALDRLNFRVLVISAEGKLLRTFGQVGQAPQDFNNPWAITFDRQKRLYLIDGMYVKVFELDGKLIRSFSCGTVANSVAVNSGGEIYLAAPRLGALMTVYSPEGKMLRQVGKLVYPQEAYPDRGAYSKHAGLSSPIPFSRVELVAGERDSVYVVFQFVPLVRKYDRSGRLDWEKRLEGKRVAGLVKGFWRERGAAPMRMTAGMDGVPLGKLALSGALTLKGNLIVLLNDGLAVLSPAGVHLANFAAPGSEWHWAMASMKGVLFVARENWLRRLDLDL